MKECIDLESWIFETNKFEKNALLIILDVMQSIAASVNRKFIQVLQNLTQTHMLMFEAAKSFEDYDFLSDNVFGKIYFAWTEIITAQYGDGSNTFTRRYIQKLCYMYLVECSVFFTKIPNVTENVLKNSTAFSKLDHVRKTSFTDLDFINSSITWMQTLLENPQETYSIFWYDSFFPKFLPFFYSTYAEVFDELMTQITISKNLTKDNLIIELKNTLSTLDEPNEYVNIADSLLNSLANGKQKHVDTYSSVDTILRQSMDVGSLFAQALSPGDEFDFKLLDNFVFFLG
jgi:hypothetical protein